MTIAIVGAGAIGTLFAAALVTHADVRLLLRDAATAARIESIGIAIDGERVHHVVATVDAARALDGADVLLVAVKTFATVDALVPLRRLVPAGIAVVSLQNGIDAASDIAYALGTGVRIALAPTTEAAMLRSPGRVLRAARGRTHIGWAAPGDDDAAVLERLVALAGASDLACERVSPIEPIAWRKLIANAGINPLTALAGVRNGDLLLHAGLRARAAVLAREAASIARASGVTLPYDDPVEDVEGVMRETAANRSSMLRDLELGRRTEIEAISGAVVRRAQRLGLTAPENARVLDEVRARAKA